MNKKEEKQIAKRYDELYKYLVPNYDPLGRRPQPIADILNEWVRSPDGMYSKYNAVGWLASKGYTVKTFTEEYKDVPTEYVLRILLGTKEEVKGVNNEQ